jgi:hypothetical protein
MTPNIGGRVAEGDTIAGDAKPWLPRGVRLTHNEAQGGWVLLAPELPRRSARRGIGSRPACREIDFGGCRCQAFLLTGDARATDPVCHLSPHHGRVVELAAVQEEAAYNHRRM